MLTLPSPMELSCQARTGEGVQQCPQKETEEDEQAQISQMAEKNQVHQKGCAKGVMGYSHMYRTRIHHNPYDLNWPITD